MESTAGKIRRSKKRHEERNTVGIWWQRLGCGSIAYDKLPSTNSRQIAFYVGLDDLLRQSDVIALRYHLLVSEQSIIDNTNTNMKDAVIVLNNNRYSIFIKRDLVGVLHGEKVHDAGPEVVSAKPITENNPLLRTRNCMSTPHIHGAPNRKQTARLTDTAASNLAQYRSGLPMNVVSP